MSARGAFWALVLSAAGAVSGLGASWKLSLGANSHAHAAHYVVTWCGNALAAVHGAGHPAGRRELLLLALLSAMALAGLVSAARTWLATRRTVSRLTANTLAPSTALAMAAEAVGLADRVVVSDSRDVFCFCFGLLRPGVCISAGLLEILDPDELAAVLAHERDHVRQRDPLKLAVANVLSALAFPLPLAADLRRAYIVGREIEADRAAISTVGRVPLASALIAILRHPRALDLRSAAAAGAIDGSRARVAQIVDPDAATRPRLSLRAAMTSLANVALVVTLLIPRPDVAADSAPAHVHAAAPVTVVADMCELGAVACGLGECSIAQCSPLQPDACGVAATRAQNSPQTGH